MDLTACRFFYWSKPEMADSSAKPRAVESPRAVANKSDRDNLLRAIRMTLEVQSAAVRMNTQTFNANRYLATALLPDYDGLKDEARRIKEKSIANLPELIQTLKGAVRARGGHVCVANTAEDACRYILDVCRWRGAKLVVKGKSITSEEIHLNPVLEREGIEVAETDLAEFILQVAGEQPSHIIAPAVHYSRERITELFKRKFHTKAPLDSGEALTKFAKDLLREKFLHADVGITGANLIAADSGTIMQVESEGNIRMASFLPPVHIAIAGVEKIVPTRREMVPFLELLAASGTGQNLAAYTSFLSPPLDDPSFSLPGKAAKPREFHLVLIDNGRLRMRDDAILREALYCIRCSACLNSCANFQTVGGHAFGGETYSGGIGGSWEAGTGNLENARFSELCTGCSRCVDQCPVRIDVPWLNENLAERLNRTAEPSHAAGLLAAWSGTAVDDRASPLSKIFFANYHYFAKWACRFAGISNAIAGTKRGRLLMERWLGLDTRRTLTPFPKQTFAHAASTVEAKKNKTPAAKVVLFADVFTNYGLVSRGVAALKVLRGLGADVVVSEVLPEGRAALSQGMIATAKAHARRAAAELEPYVHGGRDVVVVEPSSLAMFRREFDHLLENKVLFQILRASTFEVVEYVVKLLAKTGREPDAAFDLPRSPVGSKLFFHAHCQQRTIGSASATESLLRQIGFDVVTSNVECCGMAGSFGYKKDFYEMSMAVGADLFAQAAQKEKGASPRALIASGTSCTEQLQAGMKRPVMHPIELLAAMLRS
jgi:iron-sulfur cluster protein